MCGFARTMVKAVYGNSKAFGVWIGMHLLFETVMEVISREFQVGLLWEVLYADDSVVIASAS